MRADTLDLADIEIQTLATQTHWPRAWVLKPYPEFIGMTLDFIRLADRQALYQSGDTFWMNKEDGSQLGYRILGWDTDRLCLICKRSD